MNEQHTEQQYHTRYGAMTASAAALDILDRARFKAAFVGTILQTCGKDGGDVTIGGYETCGLGYILEDIGHDIQTAYDYYFGDDDTPGKLHDVPEVAS